MARAHGTHCQRVFYDTPSAASPEEYRYRIERELGQGGMATVYLAHDLKHKRPVAVKVLREELSATLGADRFLREIETTANLRHPHILPLYDSGTGDGGLLYYVMQFVEWRIAARPDDARVEAVA